MSQLRCFSVLGDSNVQRNVNKTSIRANPLVKSSQMIPCGHLAVFSEALQKVRPESSICVVACLTNFLTNADGNATAGSRVEPVLQTVLAALQESCEGSPERQYIVSPPMYRLTPVWYREGLPEVLIAFSQTLGQNRPPNLHLMPSFPTPELVDDGIHLTPFAGLEYLLYLFDSSEVVLQTLSQTPEQVLLSQCETTRSLTDRVTALEQDNKRLTRQVEDKIAVDSELADFRENERTEDCFIIEGLPQIPAEFVGKAWQELAKKHVQELIVQLMGREMKIVVVQNVTNRFREAEVKYSVKMASVADSGAIRTTFGSFFIGGKGDQRPDQFKHISIRNRVTPATKVRIEILKFLAQRHRDANPGSKVQVIGFDPRPLLKIIPPQSATDRRVRSFNFIEAIRSLPSHLSPAESEFLLKKVSLKFTGKLRSLFVILSDDDFRRRSAKQTKEAKAGPVAPASSDSAEGSSSGPGMDVDVSVSPTISVSSRSSSGTSGSSGSRAKPVKPVGTGANATKVNLKRGHGSIDSSVPAKK